MVHRGYRVAQEWWNPNYRGKALGFMLGYDLRHIPAPCDDTIYTEHDNMYLAECLENLARKGVVIAHEKVP